MRKQSEEESFEKQKRGREPTAEEEEETPRDPISRVQEGRQADRVLA